MLESLSWLSLEKKEKDIEFVQIIPFTKQKRPPYQSTQPAWDVSERSQSDLHWEREISETSQKHLKRDVFFVTYLRRPKSISKKMSFVWCDVFKTSQAYIRKGMSFPWRLWDVSKRSLASIFGFSKIRHKNDLVWFP